MNRLLFVLLTFILLVFLGCEDNKSDNESLINIIEVTTDNVNDGPYYFNFNDVAKNITTWHLLYENLEEKDGYFMPSFSLNSDVKLYVDNSLDFEKISTIPSSSLFTSSNGKLKYGGENEVLTYDMQVHKISVSDNNYIIYDTISKKIFKLHFDEYSAGVVIFRFAELNTN